MLVIRVFPASHLKGNAVYREPEMAPVRRFADLTVSARTGPESSAWT